MSTKPNFRPSEESIMDNSFVITEGVEGHWHYHICPKDGKSHTKALCGATVMPTSLTFQSWGVQTELHERYCGECMQKAMSTKLKLK